MSRGTARSVPRRFGRHRGFAVTLSRHPAVNVALMRELVCSREIGGFSCVLAPVLTARNLHEIIDRFPIFRKNGAGDSYVNGNRVALYRNSG